MSFQQNVDNVKQISGTVVSQVVSSVDQTVKNAGNAVSENVNKAKDELEQTVTNLGNSATENAKKAKDAIEQTVTNLGNSATENAKKAKDALDKSFKNIGDVAKKNANEILKDVQSEISNPEFSTCLHKTSLFVSVVLSLFAAKFYNVVDEKFILNFIFFFIIIYIGYNAILNMLF
jgi:vacuolar-type H+-ATPase subunit H